MSLYCNHCHSENSITVTKTELESLARKYEQSPNGRKAVSEIQQLGQKIYADPEGTDAAQGLAEIAYRFRNSGSHAESDPSINTGGGFGLNFDMSTKFLKVTLQDIVLLFWYYNSLKNDDSEQEYFYCKDCHTLERM